ncbi:secretory phospholipase A2 receptor-like isoform X1 [Silurus asotus]|uniref:Secretory phospholipase A2 receptor-like isoform X1 n=1 Tax=Silurus asotus TaxID=30991 RepID=A0AAD5FPB8_SILAS|nr:secretory phospholipase A2 receptor-like isoform X1 [Silurus asotus]
MRKSGVLEKYVRVVQDMYEDSVMAVKCAVGTTDWFRVKVGLHQGSALNPFLFAVVMDRLTDEVRQESPWTMMFADDIVICGERRKPVEKSLSLNGVNKTKVSGFRHLLPFVDEKYTLNKNKRAVPLVLSVTRKYYLIQDERNWTDARSYCQSTHTDLAVIKSHEDMIQLQNEADSQQFSSYAWIGMYMNMYGFHWTYGDEPLGSLMFWEDGGPNNRWGDQNCVVITPWGWNDLECYEYRPYICFDETKTGSDRYIYVDDSVEWPDAQTYCRQHYTDLASAKDENENSLLQSIISGRTWIDLIRDGWKWVDQTNFSYVTWISGEPNNYWENENCGYLEMGEAGDSQCSDIMPFFCYSGMFHLTYITLSQTPTAFTI